MCLLGIEKAFSEYNTGMPLMKPRRTIYSLSLFKLLFAGSKKDEPTADVPTQEPAGSPPTKPIEPSTLVSMQGLQTHMPREAEEIKM
jgi:hypothetical protein